MIGISQLQFPSRESSRAKFAGYFATFVSLSIIVNPANVFLSFATFFFRSEIKTFYLYKEIKAAKRQKISNKEYWEIFFKNNTIKIAFFLLFSASITYVAFTTTFLLISLFAAIPLAMILILLQSELRPKDFNPFTLLKAAINFFLEGIKENARGMVNSFDTKLEHLLPHALNDDINRNIHELKEKYDEKLSEDTINDEEYQQFIEYINNLDELSSRQFSDEDKGRLTTFLEDFCKGDERHSSGFTGGQILLLVLRACNDGDIEAIKNKKDALIVNLLDSQTFSRKERIPNTCFTGIIYRMLSTLEGIHSDPEIWFRPPGQMLLSEAKHEARAFMIKMLEKKKNYKEILNAWHKVRNDPEDTKSQEIVDDFIEEASIPLMRGLLDFTSNYTEQIVLTLIRDIVCIELMELPDDNLASYITRKVNVKCCAAGGFTLEDERIVRLIADIKEKVFLEFLNRDLLKTDFSLKDSSVDEARRIANEIVGKEVREFKSRADRAIEGQVVRMLDQLRHLPQKQRYSRICSELSQHHGEKKIKKILQKKLQTTDTAISETLREPSVSTFSAVAKEQ